jgi:hypothetical protein
MTSQHRIQDEETKQGIENLGFGGAIPPLGSTFVNTFRCL